MNEEIWKNPDGSVYMRFWSRVSILKKKECWVWNGCKDKLGYGYFYMHGKIHRAHRVSWELFYSKKFPEDKHGCHACDNPSCVNPHHIWPGTMAENIRDCFDKGRGANMKEICLLSAIKRKSRTHCKRGHELSGDNLRITVTGSRLCKTCFKASRDRYNDKIKALSSGGE